MVGGKKISQRLKGLMSSKREDALSTEMIKKSRWRLRSSRDLNLFMSLGLLQNLDSCVACIEVRLRVLREIRLRVSQESIPRLA